MIKLNTPSPFHAMWKRTANSRRRHDWNIPRLPDKLIDLSYIFLEVHNALKLVWSWPNRIISRSSVARSSVIVRFVLTKWANGSLWFDQMDQWELLICSKRNGRWLMNALLILTLSVGIVRSAQKQRYRQRENKFDHLRLRYSHYCRIGSSSACI